MEQIKMDELPVGYFVTDTPYKSGNKEFIKLGEGIVINGNGWYEQEKSLGTKHIQLKAANCNKSTLWRYFSKPCKDYPTCRYNGFTEQNAYAEELRELGKDFFIYKVSEEK